MFDISEFNYFASGNVFTGSKERFNFRIAAGDNQLNVATWYGMFSYEKSELVAQNSFGFTPQGLTEANTWLEQEYNSYKKDAEV